MKNESQKQIMILTECNFAFGKKITPMKITIFSVNYT